MASNFFTNNEGNTLIKKFKGVFENKDVHFFEVLVGYFRASGYFKLRPLLDDVEKVRILVGINVDKLIGEYHRQGQMYLQDNDKTKGELLTQFEKDIENADYDEETEQGIIQFIQDIESGKVEIKASGHIRIHAKFYIFRPEKWNEHNQGDVITGSSNLTAPGIGSDDPISNYEFNVLLSRYDDVNYAYREFESLWEKAVDILPEDITALKKKSHLREDITPYELYIKLLIEYFGDAINSSPVYDEDLPEAYVPLQYQTDAVNAGYCKMMKHNGFILGDVVGLGKTIIAVQIIRKYIRFNGFNTKTLIVYPPALEANWKQTIKDFNIRNYVDFITTGSLHKILDSKNFNYNAPEEYDMIVVDESHGFRSDDTTRYSLLQLICKTPRQNPGNDTNFNKKVMLLSATPLNNRPEDIANQLYLFQDARSSTIEGFSNLQKFFAPKIAEYKKLNKIKDHAELVKKVKSIYEPIRNHIMSQLVIRRTRKDIEKIPEYKEDIENQNMRFPDIEGPNRIEYFFNETLTTLFNDTVNELIEESGLHFYRYRAIEYLKKKEHKELYDNAEQISKQLAIIMRTLLTKRLESSFHAFKESLHRLQRANRRMINMLESDKVIIAPDLNVNKLYEDGKEDRIDEEIEKLQETGKKNNRIFKKADFYVEFLNGLIQDQIIIDKLAERWDKISFDPKYDRFKKSLDKMLNDPYNIEKKLVVFSESAETVKYLRDRLTDDGYKGIIAIDADNQKSRFNTIQNNFDANARNKKDDFNIMIATEVLAEGINLHRSNFVLNYDIPWNATRLMQRIGRVNRIGTKAEKIFVYNYYPTSNTNRLIELNEKAIKKLQGFHSAFSEDSRIYSEIEELQENILGDRQDQQEEEDESLLQLAKLRALKKSNQKEFNRIKKLPLKMRIARDVESISSAAAQIENGIDGFSLSYIRNEFMDGFYLSNGKETYELTFYQALKLFEATEIEKGYPAPKIHFKHVQKSLEDFKSSMERADQEMSIDENNLSANEKNAVYFLRNLLKITEHWEIENKDEFSKLIRTAEWVILMGTFRKLRNEIARLASEQKKRKKKGQAHPVPALIEKLSKIFNQYPLAQIQKMEEARKQEKQDKALKLRNSKIQVVLSSTFIKSQ
jgi:superfamily II DNA/RNA helicase